MEERTRRRPRHHRTRADRDRVPDARATAQPAAARGTPAATAAGPSRGTEVARRHVGHQSAATAPT